MKNILVTGANGFLGKDLCEVLSGEKLSHQYQVTAITRSPSPISTPSGVKFCSIADLKGKAEWHELLKDINTIVHTAAAVHIPKSKEKELGNSFTSVNVDATNDLAQRAAAAGVKRFIFISSIKVNGEQTEFSIPFNHLDTPSPQGLYAESKYLAEQKLKHICEKSGMEFVILRPPLIYGKNVKANFLQLIKAVNSKLPLPFGRTENKRSLIAKENFIDLIETCIWHPRAAGQTFLASDDHDISTTDLIKLLSLGLNSSPVLFSPNKKFLKASLTFFGKKDLYSRVYDNLQVDISHTKRTLDWAPPFSCADMLKYTAQYWRNQNK
ncbi:NAD-dependent epimerase/dehydratase family protein [Pokkaliibacter sp. MBI-7]|uniref:NAD-dependent epimerase/dehydratase family protein n=1 Tax=Pokkaliibacter sp. MBI-7 TaxID=3040600 RepID=UPI002447BD3E|nr:NAD-dependent epimerase/dehydratase family protein [Pokkaliibacter sp. MBI-7]MDH2434203.1 NAD-dependent epimerase/dehydratase family protein [Pokkaliibacter sp. MBI-7]